MSAPSRKPQQQQDCTHCAIRDRAICAYCGPQELEQLNAAKSYRGFPKGSSILFAGEESEFVGTIVTGVVALSKSLSDGRRQVVGLQFPSDFLGGAFRQRAPCDAVAATDVLLCMFERRSFLTLIQETPSLRDRMLDLTLDELDALRDWMTSMVGFEPLEGRWAGETLFLRGGASDYADDAGLEAARPLFPAMEVATLPGAGHWLHAEQPAEFAAAVAAFLDR